MGGITMNESDFLDDWNKTHTSSPTYQDVLDWAEQKQIEEMKELNNEWMGTLILQKQAVISKVYRWLKARNVLTTDTLIGFMDAMEEKI